MTKTGARLQVRYLDGRADLDEDPYQSLGTALQAVIALAVKNALASLEPSATCDTVMLSVPEAAKQLGVGTTKLKQLIGSGQLASVTIGRRRLVPASSVRAFGRTEEEVAG
jgi:excisionase family DNA binding protein